MYFCLVDYNFKGNIALRKPAFQSSTSEDRVAEMAVDGIMYPEVMSYSQTLLGMHAWWYVDFEEMTTVTHVSITATPQYREWV